MGAVDLLPVHIAVLTIADDAASADRATARAIAERATSVGHLVVEDEIAKDNEAAIRDQLVRWIAEPGVDVVIVAASIDSEAASAALAPLVMQALPGFTDLFRWLTFQEIGASAMLSAAEAAQCESTFVFVLPAHEGAVRAAMDKLILPQLDVRTKPKNLVTQMPRLKDEAKRLQTELQAVPTPIASEKTFGGSGVVPKPPARPKTRTANTIARKHDDPPTKPIDLAKLEKQIALSNQNDAHTKEVNLAAHQAQTKVVDMSAHHAETKVVDMSAHQAKTRVVDLSGRLPRLPPGADEDFPDDDTDALTFNTPPPPAHPPHGYRSAAPIGVVKTPAALPSIPGPRSVSEGGAGAASASPKPAGPVEKPTPVSLAKPPPALSTPSFSTPISRPNRATGRNPVVPSSAATPPGGVSTSNTATPPGGLSTSSTATPPAGLSVHTAATPPSGVSTSSTAPPPSGLSTSSAATPPSGVSTNRTGTPFRGVSTNPTAMSSRGVPTTGTASTLRGGPTTRRPGTAPLGAPPVIIPPRTAKRSSDIATPPSSAATPSSGSVTPTGSDAKAVTPAAPPAGAAAGTAPGSIAAAALAAAAAAAETATASESAAPSSTEAAPAAASEPAARAPSHSADAAASDAVAAAASTATANGSPSSADAAATVANSATSAAAPAASAAGDAVSAASSLDGIARLSDSAIEMLPDDAIETVEPPRATPPVPSPPPARKPTQPPPARKPTQPPPADPLAGLTSRPIANVDLPQGDFVYPIKRSGAGLFLKLLLAAAVLAAGFFAFVELYPRTQSTQTAAVASDPAEPVTASPPELAPTADPEPMAAEPDPAEPGSGTEEPAAVEDDPADHTEPARSRDRSSTASSTKPVTRPSRRPPPPTTDKPTATTKPAPDEARPATTAATGPVPASDDCDEVSCVMSKYDRPCCERFRPADSFRPRTQIPDELDRPMVKAGVETVKPKIVTCGEQHAAKGTVKVSVVVADVGTVKKVSVVESPDSALGECVAAAMRNAKFGKSARGGEFVYPFVF